MNVRAQDMDLARPDVVELWLPIFDVWRWLLMGVAIVWGGGWKGVVVVGGWGGANMDVLVFADVRRLWRGRTRRWSPYSRLAECAGLPLTSGSGERR